MSDQTYTVKHPETREKRTVTAREYREQRLAEQGFPAPQALLDELFASDTPPES